MIRDHGQLMSNSILTTTPHECSKVDSAISSLGIPRSATSFPVHLKIDGCSSVVVFEISLAEHKRRLLAGTAAVTSTSALHALWELPLGVQIPMRNLTTLSQNGLKEVAGDCVEISGDRVVRTYQPPGRLTAVIVAKRNVRAGLCDLSMFPPIFYRGIVSQNRSATSDDLALAGSRGVGVAVPSTQNESCLLPCEAPKLGSPSVYRWWVAELAYREYLRVGSPLN